STTLLQPATGRGHTLRRYTDQITSSAVVAIANSRRQGLADLDCRKASIPFAARNPNTSVAGSMKLNIGKTWTSSALLDRRPETMSPGFVMNSAQAARTASTARSGFLINHAAPNSAGTPR